MLANIQRGGYILWDTSTTPQIILIATGSEVGLAVDAAKSLLPLGIHVRVVSMPSLNVFLAQDPAYQHHVLPPDIRKRIAIEAASPDSWYQLVGCHGKVIGLNSFGVSAPAKEAFKEYGFTVENIISSAQALCKTDNQGKQHEHSSLPLMVMDVLAVIFCAPLRIKKIP